MSSMHVCGCPCEHVPSLPKMTTWAYAYPHATLTLEQLKYRKVFHFAVFCKAQVDRTSTLEVHLGECHRIGRMSVMSSLQL